MQNRHGFVIICSLISIFTNRNEYFQNGLEDKKQHIDKALLQQLRASSSLAFQELFDLYSGKIYNFSIGYLKDKQEAEEIVQEVFMKLWDVREELSLEKSFDSYLFTIAKNAILNTIRKSNYHTAYIEYAKLNPGKNVLLDEELDFNELNNAYLKSIESLPEKRKKIFQLSRQEGLSNAEIARELGISVKTVENQMTSALADIKRNLRSLGFSGIIFFELFL